MAHYAFLDENNVVTEVIVGKDEGDGGIDWYPTPTPTPVYFMGRIDSREISWEYEENSTPTPTPTPNS